MIKKYLLKVYIHLRDIFFISETNRKIYKRIDLLEQKIESLFHEKHEMILEDRRKISEFIEQLTELERKSMMLFHEKHEMVLEDRRKIAKLIEQLTELERKSMMLFHEKHEMVLKDRREIAKLIEQLSELKEKSMILFHEKHEMVLEDRREINYILSRIILLYYRNITNLSQEKKEILEYIRKKGLQMYPYKFTEKYMKKKPKLYETVRDEYFYIIDHGKKIYFKKDFFKKEHIIKYYNFLTMEQDYRSPHCYFDDKYKFEKNYIFIDVGAAEGLISLRIVDKAKKIILIENDIKWIDSIKKTFEPYKNKTIIYNKKCSSIDSIGNIKLSEIIKDDEDYFIKIDVEGSEMDVLKSIDFTKLSLKSRIIVCTYHNQFDYYYLSEFFRKKNIHYESSEGYVFSNWGNYKEPYFRKALIKTLYKLED